jgi:hypothetical protein
MAEADVSSLPTATMHGPCPLHAARRNDGQDESLKAPAFAAIRPEGLCGSAMWPLEWANEAMRETRLIQQRPEKRIPAASSPHPDSTWAEAPAKGDHRHGQGAKSSSLTGIIANSLAGSSRRRKACPYAQQPP